MLEKMQNRRLRSCESEDMLMEKLHQAVTLTLPLVYIMTFSLTDVSLESA